MNNYSYFQKIFYLLTFFISFINLNTLANEKINKDIFLSFDTSDSCENQKFTVEEVNKIMEDKVISIYTKIKNQDSIGSGFVISHHNNETYILTNSQELF